MQRNLPGQLSYTKRQHIYLNHSKPPLFIPFWTEVEENMKWFLHLQEWLEEIRTTCFFIYEIWGEILHINIWEFWLILHSHDLADVNIHSSSINSVQGASLHRFHLSMIGEMYVCRSLASTKMSRPILGEQRIHVKNISGTEWRCWCALFAYRSS